MDCDELDSRQALFFQLRSTFTHYDPPLGHLNDESPRLVARNASVQLADPHGPLPTFDGKVLVNAVTRDGAVVASSLDIFDASYSDLVRMAKIGTGLEAALAPASGDKDSSRVGARWLNAVLDDYLPDVPPKDVICVAPADDQHDNVTGATYEIGTVSGRASVRLSHGPLATTAFPGAWLLVGTSAKELWT